MSRFKFMHTLPESKSIFAIEQKAIVFMLCKNVAFLLGHPVDQRGIKVYISGKVSSLGFKKFKNQSHRSYAKKIMAAKD